MLATSIDAHYFIIYFIKIKGWFMRLKDGERVISKLFKIIELFLTKKSVTSDDIANYTGMSKRSAQRYLKDAIENMDIRKNQDGSYSLLNKSSVYSFVKRDDSYLTATMLQYAKALFPETRYDAIEKYISLFNLQQLAPAVQVLESSSIDFNKIDETIRNIEYFLKYHFIKMKFTYLKDNKQKETTPYKIIFYNGFWYLIGFNDNEEVRAYRIDYICDVSSSGEKAITISEKSKKMVDNTTSIWFGNEELYVDIVLDECIKEYFIERPIFKNMEVISENPFTIKVMVYNYMALYMELMPYAPYFTILTPEAKEFFAERFKAAYDKHKE